ncbi:MAG: helix-turn-helix domain-containing protein [Clostridia bacterium]|nr:helix-turn-helix domain-containing protein [Clostridia bacterium]
MFDHQIHNSVGNVYNAFIYEQVDYPPHFHKGFEFIYSMGEGASVGVNDRSYRLQRGDCVLVPPYASHSMSIRPQSECLVIVFSAHYAESAAKQFQSGTPNDYLFRLSVEAESFIRQNLICDLLPFRAHTAVGKPPLLRLKACLYAIFDEFLNQQPLASVNTDGLLIGKVIECIEEGYTTDLTLTSIAQKLGYSYDYLSRVFCQTLHMNFKTTLNHYRCEHALHLLRTTERTLTDISMDSGFQSIRSFNRVFKDLMGCSPSEFRKNEE